MDEKKAASFAVYKEVADEWIDPDGDEVEILWWIYKEER